MLRNITATTITIMGVETFRPAAIRTITIIIVPRMLRPLLIRTTTMIPQVSVGAAEAALMAVADIMGITKPTHTSQIITACRRDPRASCRFGTNSWATYPL